MADTSPATELRAAAQEPRALVLARRAAHGKPLTQVEGAALLADLEHLHTAADRLRADLDAERRRAALCRDHAQREETRLVGDGIAAGLDIALRLLAHTTAGTTRQHTRGAA